MPSSVSPKPCRRCGDPRCITKLVPERDSDCLKRALANVTALCEERFRRMHQTLEPVCRELKDTNFQCYVDINEVWIELFGVEILDPPAP